MMARSRQKQKEPTFLLPEATGEHMIYEICSRIATGLQKNGWTTSGIRVTFREIGIRGYDDGTYSQIDEIKGPNFRLKFYKDKDPEKVCGQQVREIVIPGMLVNFNGILGLYTVLYECDEDEVHWLKSEKVYDALSRISHGCIKYESSQNYLSGAPVGTPRWENSPWMKNKSMEDYGYYKEGRGELVHIENILTEIGEWLRENVLGKIPSTRG